MKIPGNIRVKFKDNFKRPNLNIISTEIAEISGVVKVWYTYSKLCDLLIDIEVENYDEGKAIESIIKNKPFVKDTEAHIAVLA
jgi:hypothetical protein